MDDSLFLLSQQQEQMDASLLLLSQQQGKMDASLSALTNVSTQLIASTEELERKTKLVQPRSRPPWPLCLFWG
ncbi:hypothetical protein Pyn_04461 [Prunus yedoensis var. nudiflora]|uniref:Uncharacterized protein n=1 Tax=Prunus yedoensis var. nudiflora TaxID=2094558 RepID=A0A314XLT1_PRUYE|nr:hypothetical protein Pyn_04461 [Prunus yedoensis var. nudiflora]